MADTPYRVRVTLERSCGPKGWEEIDSEVLFIHDGDGKLSTIGPAGAARIAFQAVIRERDERMVKGVKSE